MPRLPDVTAQAWNTPKPPQGVAQLPSGTGMEGVPAEASAAMGAQMAQVGAQIQNQVDETAVNDTYANKFSPQFRQLYQQYYSLQGKDAVDAMPQFQQKMQALRNQTLDGLQTSQQRDLFSKLSNRRIEYEQDGMSRYADQQFKIYKDQTHLSSLANYQNQAADYTGTDPIAEHGFGTALGSGIAEIDRYAAATGQSPEMARVKADAFASAAIVGRIARTALTDPMGAQELYRRYASEIDAKQRPVIEHQIKSAVQPVEARDIAAQALGSIVTHTALTGIGASVGNPAFMGLKGDPDEIARQVLNTSGMSQEDRAGIMAQIERQKSAAGGVTLAPNTRNEVMAKIGDGLAKVQQLADALHPNDPVFADMASAQFMGHLNKIAAATTGLSKQAHDTVMSRAAGLDGTAPPLTPQELLSDPKVAQAWTLLSPDSQQAFLSANGVLAQNARQANGEFTRSDPKLVNDLRQRIYLPDGDPQKLTSPTQLTPYFANGLNYTDSEHLKKEIAESNTPEGNPFLKQVNVIKTTATKMLTGSMSASVLQHPELAQESAYRFGLDLDNKIKAARAAGRDAQELFIPGSKDYVLDPNRVASFMPTEQQAAAAKARGTALATTPGGAATGARAVPRLSNETPADYLKRIGH